MSDVQGGPYPLADSVLAGRLMATRLDIPVSRFMVDAQRYGIDACVALDACFLFAASNGNALGGINDEARHYA